MPFEKLPEFALWFNKYNHKVLIHNLRSDIPCNFEDDWIQKFSNLEHTEKHKDDKEWLGIYVGLHIYFSHSLSGMNGLNPDCFFNVFANAKDGLAYVTPSFALARHEPKQFPKYVERYFYWDNSDHARNISEKEWEERGRNWDAVIDPEIENPVKFLKFTHHYIECPNYYNHSLLNIAQEILGKDRGADCYVCAKHDAEKRHKNKKDRIV